MNLSVYWHDEKPDHMTIMETRTAASRAEIYISSVNAISENGEIVNIDNTGNRVAAISYGPSKVYLLVGSNKVTKNLVQSTGIGAMTVIVLNVSVEICQYYGLNRLAPNMKSY